MAFREPTFTEGLDQLNKGNFLGGLVLAAQGDLIKQQTLSTQNIISTFSQRLQELESTPLTTEEQLARLNQDPETKGNITNLQDMIGDYQSLTYSIFERQKMINSIYGDTMNALAGVGGETAERVSGSLKGQYGMKTKELEQLAEMPFKSLEFQKTTLGLIETRFDITKKSEELRLLGEDEKAKNLLFKMISSNEVTKLKLSYNRDTGKYSYNMNDLYKEMYAQYGKLPEFSRAFLGVQEFLYKNTQVYNPEPLNLGGMSGSRSGMGIPERTAALKTLHSWCRDNGSWSNTANNSKDPFWVGVREEYLNATRDAYPEEWAKAQNDPLARQKAEYQKFFRFGMDRKGIDQMEDGTAKDRALTQHNLLYNKHSDTYYPKYLREFELLIDPTGKTKIIGDGANLVNGSIIDPVTGDPYPITGWIPTGGRWSGDPSTYEINFGNKIPIGNPEDEGDEESLTGLMNDKSGRTKEMFYLMEQQRQSKKKKSEHETRTFKLGKE